MVTGNNLHVRFFEKRSIFNKANLESCELSIQLMPDGFSFLIHHPDQLKILALGSFEKADPTDNLLELLKDFWTKEPILNRTYKKVQFIFSSMHAIWTPKELFDHDTIDQLFDFNIEKEESQVIRTSFFPEQSAYLSYSIDKGIHEFVQFNFPNALQLHITEILFPIAYQQKDVETKAFLYSNGALMDLWLMNGKKLIFHKSFVVTSDEERAYYTFFSLKQLEFSLQKMNLYLIGDLSENCRAYFDKYVRNVSSLQQGKFSTKELKKVPENEFYPLLNC